MPEAAPERWLAMAVDTAAVWTSTPQFLAPLSAAFFGPRKHVMKGLVARQRNVLQCWYRWPLFPRPLAEDASKHSLFPAQITPLFLKNQDEGEEDVAWSASFPRGDACLDLRALKGLFVALGAMMKTIVHQVLALHQSIWAPRQIHQVLM